VQLLPDTIVRLRQCRWRVIDVHPFDDCTLVHVRGVAPPVAGVERRVLVPFDTLDPIARRSNPTRVGRHRWRRACRALLANDTPPGGLRTATRARIDLHPHQLAPAIAVLRGLGCRLLLADAVGLGKTIQAGAIVSELMARASVERVLVLTPAGLRDQWRAELCDRFGLRACVLDALTIRQSAASLPPDVSPWCTTPLAIASIDYVKRPDVLAAASQRPWDLLVVDEAHGSASDSDRRAAVDALASRASYVVLVTATPHSGDREAFASLCRIGQVPGDRLLVFRRTRADVNLWTPRHVRTLHVRLGRDERRLHAALRRYSDAVIDAIPAAWLALSVLHKRALSSAAALAESVERRIAILDARTPVSAISQLALPLDTDTESTPDDEPPAWDASLTLDDPRRERRLLGAIATAARLASRRESKIAALHRLLRRVREPVVVFTEYRDTLHHVCRAIDRPTLLLHGGLSRDERRIVVDTFARTANAVLLATDAAGEGLNLHAACRLVVNLELPWNPMRLEQRIGRVDRIGQTRTVHAMHLVARGTREGALLARLEARLQTAQSAVGAPNPLGDERASAAIVVLRRTPMEPPAVSAATPDLEHASLADEALSEARRLLDVRRVLSTRAGDPGPSDILVNAFDTFARPSLARVLRGRTLEIWRVVADDGGGRRVETHLVPVLVEREHGDVAGAVSRAAAPWRADAERIASDFSDARRRRDVAILEREAIATPPADQPSLFGDRRHRRERLATAFERNTRRADLAARVNGVAATGALIVRAPELLLRVRWRA
jgi:superfamily II DNA or RNA helicase